MNECQNPNCHNTPNQTWKIEFDGLTISHDLCDECARLIEFSEFSNSSFSNIK